MSLEGLSPNQARKQRIQRRNAITALFFELDTRRGAVESTLESKASFSAMSDEELFALGAFGQEHWILAGLREAVNSRSRWTGGTVATFNGPVVLDLKRNLPEKMDEIERAKQAGIMRVLDTISDPNVGLSIPLYGLAQRRAQELGLQVQTVEGLDSDRYDQLEVPTKLPGVMIAYSYAHLPTGDTPLPTSRPEAIILRVKPIKATRRERKPL